MNHVTNKYKQNKRTQKVVSLLSRAASSVTLTAAVVTSIRPAGVSP